MARDQAGTPIREGEEDLDESVIRPERFSEFVGQDLLKETLRIAIDAARARGEPLDHTLFSGPPGLGKTTLAHIIAREMGSDLHCTSGPVLEKPGDLAAILTLLKRGDVLFIDEIHRLHTVIEEILYPAMEDFCIDVMIGDGPSARSIKITLEPFTLVGATTRVGLLGSPFRDRFGLVVRLNLYSTEELAEIVTRSAGIMKIPILPGVRSRSQRGAGALPGLRTGSSGGLGTMHLCGVTAWSPARSRTRPSRCSVSTTSASTRWTGGSCTRSSTSSGAGRWA